MNSKLNIARSFAILCLIIALMLSSPMVTACQAPAPDQEDYLLYLPILLEDNTPSTPFWKVNLNFSPYIDGQDPNTGITLSETQIRQRLSLIAPYSRWVRSFGCGSGLEAIGRVGHQMGVKVAAGAWIGRDLTINQDQINCLIAEAKAGNIDMAVVGSEALLRGDVTVETLIQYLDQVRAEVPASIPVTTADVYSVLLDNPELIDHVDVVLPNIYPFWEGYPIQHAVAVVDYWYKELVETYSPKPVYISETGWPSCGSFNESIGSPANQAAYFNQTVSWARENDVFMFYFAALDESWKMREEGLQGACWGISDRQGKLKPGMEPALLGVYTSHETELPLTCGASTPSIEFMFVPEIGSEENVTGKACGVVNLEYNVVLFIKVGETWWVKPYQNKPYTAIAPDGSWEVDYTTGGIDEEATIMRAYLLPKGVDAFGDLSSYPFIEKTR